MGASVYIGSSKIVKCTQNRSSREREDEKRGKGLFKENVTDSTQLKNHESSV